MNFQKMVRDAGSETSAFDELYEEYYVRLFRYLYSRVGAKDEVDDMVQTVFLKALGRVTSWDTIVSPRAYLFTVCRNVLIDHYRKKKSLPASAIDMEMRDVGDESASVEERQMNKDEIGKALGDIKESYREVIELRFFADMSYTEIAEVVGKKEDNVRQLCSRAVKSLGVKLEAYEQ